MAKQARTCSNRDIARDRRGMAGPAGMAAALMLVVGVVALAAPQAATPAQPPASQGTSPATAPATGKPVAPSAAAQAAAELIAKAKVGDAEVAAKEYDAAIATYQSLLPDVNDRGRGELWAHIGEAYRFKLDYVNSLQAFEKAYALMPDDIRVVSNLGLLYDEQNDKVRARLYYEKVIQINPNNPLILNNLAFLLAETGAELDLALTYARMAQAKAPTAPEIDDTIGWIDLKKNMVPGAIAEFQKVTLLSPYNPTYHYHYAMALKQKGDATAAGKECKAALDGSPAPSLLEQIKKDCAGLLPEQK